MYMMYHHPNRLNRFKQLVSQCAVCVSSVLRPVQVRKQRFMMLEAFALLQVI